MDYKPIGMAVNEQNPVRIYRNFAVDVEARSFEQGLPDFRQLL